MAYDVTAVAASTYNNNNNIQRVHVRMYFVTYVYIIYNNNNKTASK